MAHGGEEGGRRGERGVCVTGRVCARVSDIVSAAPAAEAEAEAEAEAAAEAEAEAEAAVNLDNAASAVRGDSLH